MTYLASASKRSSCVYTASKASKPLPLSPLASLREWKMQFPSVLKPQELSLLRTNQVGLSSRPSHVGPADPASPDGTAAADAASAHPLKCGSGPRDATVIRDHANRRNTRARGSSYNPVMQWPAVVAGQGAVQRSPLRCGSGPRDAAAACGTSSSGRINRACPRGRHLHL